LGGAEADKKQRKFDRELLPQDDGQGCGVRIAGPEPEPESFGIGTGTESVGLEALGEMRCMDGLAFVCVSGIALRHGMAWHGVLEIR
jgi:hypothetical protein